MTQLKVKPMKYDDIVRKLKELWCKFMYNCWWSHRIWNNPKTLLDFTVVDHWAKEVIPSTISKMLKTAWIDRKDFLN